MFVAEWLEMSPYQRLCDVRIASIFFMAYAWDFGGVVKREAQSKFEIFALDSGGQYKKNSFVHFALSTNRSKIPSHTPFKKKLEPLHQSIGPICGLVLF